MSQKIKLSMAVLWLLVTLFVYGYLLVSLKMNNENGTGNFDFAVFYRSTQLYFHGEDIYHSLQSVEKKSVPFPVINQTNVQPVEYTYVYSSANGNLNPPFLTLIILWLGKFKFVTAFRIWLSLSIAAIMASIYLLQREHGVKNFFSPPTVLFTTAVLCYFPVFINFSLGQLGLFICLGIVLLWIACQRKQEAWAGIILGMLVSLKLFFGVLVLFFILQKHWRLLMWSLVTAAVIFVTGLLVFGPTVYASYSHSLSQIGNYVSNWNGSVYGYLFQMQQLIGEKGKYWINSIYGVVSLFLIGLLAYWSCFSKAPAKQNFDLGFAFALCVCLFLSPLSWNYYFPMLVVAFYTVLRLVKYSMWPKTVYLLVAAALTLTAIPSYLADKKKIFADVFSIYGSSRNFYALLMFMLAIIILQLTLKNKTPLVVDTKKQEVVIDKMAIRFRQYIYIVIVIFSVFFGNIYGQFGGALLFDK